MNPRPQTLREVAEIARANPRLLQPKLSEFLDEFYGDHGDPAGQQRRIDDEPPLIGNALHDAWIAAVGEHLALRWGLRGPQWVERPQGFELADPVFMGPQNAKAILLAESPYPFRRRMIFIEEEPLRRASFPGKARCVFDGMTVPVIS